MADQRASDREAALRESEARFRAIFNGTGDGLIITATDGRVVEINPAACAMFGYAREDAIGLPLSTLTDFGSHARLEDLLKRIVKGEASIVRAVNSRRDGTPFDVEVHSRGFTYAGEPHVLSVVRDVTDRVHSVQLLEQRVQERTRELSTLLQISRDVASTLQLEPLLTKTLDLLGEVVSYDAAAIFALDDQDHLDLLDYRGPWSILDLPRHWELSELEHIRMVVERRQPLTIPDVHATTRRARAWQQTWGKKLGVLAIHSTSWLGVPLVAKDCVIGALTLEHADPGHFTLLHAKLALAFANQVAVAFENARLHEAAQRLAVLEERQRIARELHDSVSQALYGIGLGARTARATLDDEPAQAMQALTYVLGLAQTALADMRAILLELRPDVLEQDGLISALDKQVASLRTRYDLQISTDLPEEPAISEDVKEALYRVAYEALGNIVKHAQAHHVSVELAIAGREISLSIRDDGVGFDTGGTYPGHFGLQSMRERTQRLGGRLIIDSAPTGGTCVRAVIPFTDSAASSGRAPLRAVRPRAAVRLDGSSSDDQGIHRT